MNNPPAFYERRKNNQKAPALPKITEEERIEQENQVRIRYLLIHDDLFIKLLAKNSYIVATITRELRKALFWGFIYWLLVNH